MAITLESTKKYFDEVKKGNENRIFSPVLVEWIDAKEDLFLLDIRKKDVFSEKHIKGSVNCEWSQVYELIEEDGLPKNKKTVVICNNGQGAGQIVAILKLLGYDACALRDGMENGWLENDLPVESVTSAKK